MAQQEENIRAAGAEIIWVLEATTSGQAGTAVTCADFIGQESDQGWCVGDGQTQPLDGEWDDSPFSIGRGFDIIVPRSTMVIEYTTSHGTPSGNDNLTGQDILQAVEDVIDSL